MITHNARRHLERCLPPIFDSPLKKRVLVVNSSSGDGTVERAQELGAEVLVVPRREFNHGATRELARKHLGTDIAVMMTPDAYATGPEFLQYLVQPLMDGTAAVSYARQIPHEGADFFERFPREFNYPAVGDVRGLEELAKFGSSLIFCSNSCAAWSNSALDEVGGFPAVLTNEEAFVLPKLFIKGHRIAYVAESVVRHSHRYDLRTEFGHYFDIGYARAGAGKGFFFGQRDEGRGSEFVAAMLRRLWREHPAAIPYAVFQSAVKYLGYRAGRVAVHFPLWLPRLLSAQDYYWTSIHCTR